MTLTYEQATLLERMRNDAKLAGAPFYPEGHWDDKHVGYNFAAWFGEVGIGLVEEQHYNNHFASYLPPHISYFHFACSSLFRLLQTRDKWNVLPNLHSTLPEQSPRRSVIEGQVLSWDALISADTLFSIAEVEPSVFEPGFVLADLGAGWGRIGAAYKQMNPGGTYLVFDIPETLLISSTYLPQVLPNETFHTYGETCDMELLPKEMLNDWGIWFMGAYCLSRVENKAIDCIVNIASLNEMSLEYQYLYWDVFEKVARSVYNLQHYLGGHIRKPWEQVYHRPVSWAGDYYEEFFKI